MTQESLFIICITMAVIMVSMGAVWVYKDAAARGLNGLLWAFVAFIIPSFLGVLFYFLFGRRTGRTYCKTCTHEVLPSEYYCHYCNQTLDKEGIVTPAVFVSGKAYIIICVICFLIMLSSFVWLLVLIAQNHLT